MTIGKMDNIEDHTIYCDLLRCFRDAGHKVYTISPYEKVTGLKTKYEKKNGVNMLHLQFIKNNQQIENRLLMNDDVHDFDLLPTPQFFAYGFGDLLGLHQPQW